MHRLRFRDGVIVGIVICSLLQPLVILGCCAVDRWDARLRPH